jgi:tetratricopeptide (TPR) repeat protein
VNLEPLARRVPTGTTITLTMRNGDVFAGAVVEWGDDYVIVNGAEGGEQYLTDDVITGINVPKAAFSVPGSESVPVPSPGSSTATAAPSAPAVVPLAPAAAARPPAAPVAQLPPGGAGSPDWWPALEREYESVTRRATIGRHPVDIGGASEAVQSIAGYDRTGGEQRTLDQIRSKYLYGVKVKENSRFLECARMVSALELAHPGVPEFSLLRASLLAEAGQFGEALFALDGHPDSAEVQYQRAALAMHLNRPGWALGYLEQLFIIGTPVAESGAWFLFVRLLLQSRQFSRMTNVIAAAPPVVSASTDLICGGALYVLSRIPGADRTLFTRPVRPGLEDIRRALAAVAPPADSDALPVQLQEGPVPGPANDVQSLPAAGPVAAAGARTTAARPTAPVKPAAPQKAAGLYASARQAEDDGRLEEAEKFYRRAIDAEDNREKAVKSLAWLMQRLRRGPEAIELIDRYRPVYQGSESYENVRISLLQHNGHHLRAAEAIREAIGRAAEQRRPVLLQQRAYSLIRAGSTAEATEALRELIELDPTNHTARTWLNTVTKAVEHDDVTLLDAIIANKLTAAQEAGISDLLVFHLELCRYSGVDARRVATLDFRDTDIDELRKRTAAEKRKPDVRAQYNLSGAKILLDMNRGDDPAVREFLQYFCAGMADAAVLGQQHHDVARNFHLEAFQTADRWNRNLDQLLEQFVRSYSDQADTILRANGNNIGAVLTAIGEQPAVARAAFLGLLQLAVASRAAAQRIIKATFATEDTTREQWQRLCLEYAGDVSGGPGQADDPDRHAELWTQAIDRARARQRDLTSGLFLLLGSLDLALLGEHVTRIAALPTADCNELDRSRLTSVTRIIERAAEYAAQSDYREQERLSSLLDRDIDMLVGEIEREPTKLSFEWLRRYVRDLSGLVLDDFARRQASAEPSSLNVKLLTESCGVDAEGLLGVQVETSLSADKSPASAVTLTIEPQPAEYTCSNSTILVTQSLNPDRPAFCSVNLRPTPEAIANQVLTLRYSLSFSTRGGDQVQSEVETLSIALYENTNFKQLENPYLAGGPVDAEEMFFGRDELLNKLVDSAVRGSYRSAVIWGQMRTGKSTVLLQLKRKLIEGERNSTGPLRVLPANFSLLDTIIELTFPNFLNRIVKSIAKALDEMASEGWPRLDLGELPVIENQSNAQADFDECMLRIRRALDAHPAYSGVHLVLLIDEFTNLYGQIRKTRVPDTFMLAWKGMYEKRYFSSVIVGTDVMPEFISQYKNAFQVSQNEKVNYLPFEDAKKLIEDPILLPDGGSRFRGDAVRQIFDLTAGNPYYIQFFCEHLVNHINEKQALLVGPGDVEEVASSLIEESTFDENHLDNLTAPSSLMDNAPTADLTLKVLLACVSGTPGAPSFDDETHAAQQIPETAAVLNELANREVIQQLQGTRFQVRVGLFARWLVHQAALGRHSA